MNLDSLVNAGEYLSAHYLAEVLPKQLRQGRLAAWTKREKAGEQTPRTQLRALRTAFFTARPVLDAGAPAEDSALVDPSWRAALDRLHDEVLSHLGFEPARDKIIVVHSGAEHLVPVLHHDRDVIAIECGWATDVDAALDSGGAGRLPASISVAPAKELTTGAALASFLFGAEPAPRYVLILTGAVLVLADRFAWGEGRYLAVNLDTALGRSDTTVAGELDVIAALFSAESLHTPAEGGDGPLAQLVSDGHKHAVGVSEDLRKGLQRSVELIANEVLDRIRDASVDPGTIDEQRALADRLTRESLRYLYRILFLLYAEARPDLGVLPADYPEYSEGYGMNRLGELASLPLVDVEAHAGLHLYESLALLFRLVNEGHRARAMGESRSSEDEGIRFEQLNSDLFDPEAITLIGEIEHPGWDPDEPDAVPRTIDTRLRNECLHRVLRLLMLTRGKKKERGGFISYAQLGINQLGAVYEGLMSYTGFIATEELYEVARNGDDSGGSWTVPASKAAGFEDSFVYREDEETGEKVPVRHPEGSFVYRLAGRDRQTSASYYTPESLTKATVHLALRQRIEENPVPVRARDLLDWKICEPALGSGAFLNEAINQIATEYLRRRKDELGDEIEQDDYETELRRVKAYIALHNCYGVDLNETAVELAEVSIWLNVMHPGLAAPWFGLHLRRGNSLIGAGRRYYPTDALTKGEWLLSKGARPPIDHPLRDGDLPDDAVHHFLLPAVGWGALVTDNDAKKEAKALAPDEVAQLTAWRSGLLRKPKQGKQIQRLQGLAQRVEYLWGLVINRLELSEQEIRRRIPVWGAEDLKHPKQAITREKVYSDLHAPGSPYWRLKTLMNTWCALWFLPGRLVSLLDGTAPTYADSWRTDEMLAAMERAAAKPAEQTVTLPFAEQGTLGLTAEQGSLWGEPEQITSTAAAKNPTGKRRLDTGTTGIGRRSVIPLADLDNWLDFAEALVGRANPEGTLFSAWLTNLDEVSEVEDALLETMSMDPEYKLADRFPWLGPVLGIANQHGFFHWELDFAHIFKVGGFDLQLGNPPWVRPTWDEPAVLAEHDAWFGVTDLKVVPDRTRRQRRSEALTAASTRDFYLDEFTTQAATAKFLSSPVTYQLLTGTQPDFYRGFMIRVWANQMECGTAGLLHPDTHFVGDKERALRSAAYRRLRVHGDFVNAGNRFFPPPVNRSSHFGLHIYGSAREPRFEHLCWLFGSSVLVDSLARDAKNDDRMVGVRVRGTWDVQPHRSRVINVNREKLVEWGRLSGEAGVPVDEVKLLYPVTEKEQDAIAVLGAITGRIGEYEPQISPGYHEKGSKDNGLIEWWVGQPEDWSDVILKGPQLGVATPFFKQPPNTGTGARPQDLTQLAANVVPGTSYRCATVPDAYRAAQDRWVDRRVLAELLASTEAVEDARLRVAARLSVIPGDVKEEDIKEQLREQAKRPYTNFYRLAWRRRIADDTDRSLFAALIPPGPAHVDSVHTIALSNNRETTLTAGFWAALPLDYILRVTGRTDLRVAEARRMPAADCRHTLAHALLLRTLRLNCLASAYAPLWAELYEYGWRDEHWVVDWPRIQPLGNVSREWTANTPLRTEWERRAALVEIDALVAVWLGLSAQHLAAIYLSRYPILHDYEEEMWFDSNGRKLAGNWNAFGHGQTKEHYKALVAHLEDGGPPPEGYEPPFYKADRVGEMTLAHAAFSKRLEEAG